MPSHRERLLEAMTRTAARHSYAGASVARIIEQAGVSRATFYEHFGSREECFAVAYRRIVSQARHDVRSAAERAPLGQRPAAVLVRLLDVAAANPAAARLVLIEALGGPPTVRAEHEQLIADVESSIDEFLGERSPGTASLQIPAAALLGGVGGILSTHLLQSEVASLPCLRSQLMAWIESHALGAGVWRWEQVEWDALGGGQASAEEGEKTEESEPSLLPRGRSSLSAGQVAVARRERIIAAICRLIATKGYIELTVADIVEAARVPRGAFYAHFRGKRDAFSAAQTMALQGSIGAAAAEFFVGETLPERVWRAGDALLRYMAKNPDLTYLGMVESYAVGEAIRRQHDTRTAFTIFLEEGYRTTAWPERLPRLTSDAIGWAVFALVRREVAAGRTSELPAILPEAAYVILAPFLGPEAAMGFAEARAREASVAA